MTLALNAPSQGVPVTRQAALTLPGLTERVLVVVTTFVLLHETPNSWFRLPLDSTGDVSNPLLVATQLLLVTLAFARVAGSIDHLLVIIRTEPVVFAFSALTMASLFWSADPALTFRRGLLFVSVTVYATYLLLRFALDQILRLLAMMFTLSTVVNTVFIVALPTYGLDGENRFTGVFSQKNALGFTAALALPILLAAARSYPPGRVVFYPVAVAQVVLLIGSESKTMLVAAAVPTLLMGVYHGFRGRKTLRGAVILSLLTSGAFAAAFATANIALLARWLNKDVTLTGRVPLWENLLPIALDAPVLGHGYGATFNGYFSPIHEVWIQNIWNPSHAHNALLQIWLEIGLIGVALFVYLYLRGVSMGIRIVAIVPGAVGLWPLTYLTFTLMISITEAGVMNNELGWMLFVIAILAPSFHLRHRRALGLSNDLRLVRAGVDHTGPGPAVDLVNPGLRR